MFVILISAGIATVACTLVVIASLFSPGFPKRTLIGIVVLWVLFLLWSWISYPGLEREIIQIHDYGTIAGITPSGGRGPVMVETTSGVTLRLYPDFPLHKGDSVRYYVKFEGGTAEYYYLIDGKREGGGLIQWNMPGWKKTMQLYPASSG